MNATLLDISPKTSQADMTNKSKCCKTDGQNDFFDTILGGLTPNSNNTKGAISGDLLDVLFQKLQNLLMSKTQKIDIEDLSVKDLKEIKQKLVEVLENIDKNIDLKALKDAHHDKPDIEVALEDIFKMLLFVQQIEKNIQKLPHHDAKVTISNDMIKDIKDAKNITQLFKVAKKSGIEIKKFKFIKLEEKHTFTNLLKQTKPKSEELIKLIDTKQKPIEKAVHSTLSNLLQSVDKGSKAKNELKTEQTQVQKVQPELPKTELKQKVEVKPEQPKPVEQKVVQPQQTEVKKQEVKVQPELSKTELKQKVVTSTKVSDIHHDKDLKSDKEITAQIKLDNKENQPELQTIKNIKQPQKLEVPVKQQSQQTLKVDKETVEQENSNEIEVSQEDNKTQTEKVQTTKTTHTHHDKTKVTKTLNTFAQEFKEQVESYKPPLMKIKMQLKPVGMGEVDVTMINRGNNLHITVQSNQNTIAIFSQNQTEFKNSLVNLGFSELSMNFNEKGGQKEQQNQKNSKQTDKNFDEFSQDESFEMTTPIYI